MATQVIEYIIITHLAFSMFLSTAYSRDLSLIMITYYGNSTPSTKTMFSLAQSCWTAL